MKINHNYRFKSGKYANKTYFEVWDKDPDYFYWMAGQFGAFWESIVKELEQRDKQRTNQKPKSFNFPTLEKVKQIFISNPICGFDMSDYICKLYESCPDSQKNEYFQSLLYRNKINLI